MYQTVFVWQSLQNLIRHLPFKLFMPGRCLGVSRDEFGKLLFVVPSSIFYNICEFARCFDLLRSLTLSETV